MVCGSVPTQVEGGQDRVNIAFFIANTGMPCVKEGNHLPVIARIIRLEIDSSAGVVTRMH